MDNKIWDEETCTRCEETIYGIFDEKELYKHKIGKIRCPKCGHINPPCNMCEDPTACDTPDCPWFNAKVQDGLTLDEYFKWLRVNDPVEYEFMKDPKHSGDYARMIKEMEKEGMQQGGTKR